MSRLDSNPITGHIALNRKPELSGGITMKKIFLTIITGSLLLVFAGNTSAFDGKRSGFIIEVGTGIGGLSIDESGVKRAVTYGTIIIDYKLGFGLSEKVIIFWSGKMGFYKINNSLHMQVFRGPGISYYLKNNSKSLYFTTTIGVEKWGNFALGVGYKFEKSFNVEVNIFRQEFSDQQRISSVRLTINSMYF